MGEKIRKKNIPLKKQKSLNSTQLNQNIQETSAPNVETVQPRWCDFSP